MTFTRYGGISDNPEALKNSQILDEILLTLKRGGIPALTGLEFTADEIIIMVTEALSSTKDIHKTKDWILNVLITRLLPSPQA